MFGLVVSAGYCAVLFAGGANYLAVFKRVTKFLFYWYLVAAILLATIFGFSFVTGSTVLGLIIGGVVGGLAGSVFGSILALTFVISIAIAYILQICGARILHNSLAIDAGGKGAWQIKRLIVGIIMLAIGLFVVPLLS